MPLYALWDERPSESGGFHNSHAGEEHACSGKPSWSREERTDHSSCADDDKLGWPKVGFTDRQFDS